MKERINGYSVGVAWFPSRVGVCVGDVVFGIAHGKAQATLNTNSLTKRLGISLRYMRTLIAEAEANPAKARIPWPPAHVHIITRRREWDEAAVEAWIAARTARS